MLTYVRRHHAGLLALFVALSGTAYAAIELPARSVGTRELKPNAVTASRLSQGLRSTLNTLSAKPGVPGPPGAPGAQGAPGATGPRGATGDRGATGERGAQGDAGSAGTNGTNGTNGTDGTDAVTSGHSFSQSGPTGVTDCVTTKLQEQTITLASPSRVHALFTVFYSLPSASNTSVFFFAVLANEADTAEMGRSNGYSVDNGGVAGARQNVTFAGLVADDNGDPVVVPAGTYILRLFADKTGLCANTANYFTHQLSYLGLSAPAI